MERISKHYNKKTAECRYGQDLLHCAYRLAIENCWLVYKYFSKELKYIFEHPYGFISQNQQVMAWKLFVCAPISHVMLRVDDEWFGCQAGEMRSPGLVAGPVLARGSQLYFLLSPGPGPGSHTTTWSLYTCTPVHTHCTQVPATVRTLIICQIINIVHYIFPLFQIIQTLFH